MSRSGKYLPTLDGWRAVAIISVMLCHDSVRRIGFFSTQWFVEHGDLGVDVFFGISGILICYRLLQEETFKGVISLKEFYIKRVARILPPAFIYLGALAILTRVSVLNVGPREILGSLLFYRNYTSPLHLSVSHPGWYTGHFWSLSLEEQFYLFLPFVLVVSRKYRLSVLGVAMALVAVRCGFQIHARPWSLIRFHTDVRLNSLLIPAMFSIVLFRFDWARRFAAWFRFWPLIGILILGIETYLNVSLWSIQAIAFLMPCMLYGSILNPTNLLSRILELPAVRYVGRISYSLYIWQQLFIINHLDKTVHPLGKLQSWPACFILTFIFAMASFHFVEQPIIRLGRKLISSLEKKDLQAV